MMQDSIYLSDIRIYPIKSTQPLSLDRSRVHPIGLENDRRLVIVDAENQVITGRSNPYPLRVRTSFENGRLHAHVPGYGTFEIDPEKDRRETIEVKLFGRWIPGYPIENECNSALSELLGERCHLAAMTHEIARAMKPEDGARAEDRVSYADTAPIHLVSEASLADLNSRLSAPVPMDRFRPNLIVRGCGAYEEERWDEIDIGDARFRVADTCKRCVFTTLDPSTLERDPGREPLKTLSTYRMEGNKVKFGVHLVPLRPGTIRTGDEILIRG